jgi:hypothetical protein
VLIRSSVFIRVNPFIRVHPWLVFICGPESFRVSPCSSVARIRVFVESKRDLRSVDQDGPADEVWLLHHQIDRFLLRFRQGPLLEHRASSAHEVEEPAGIDVLLEKRPRRRFLVDVMLFNVDVLLVQITSGVAARGSGRFPIENRSRHGRILPAAGSMFPAGTMDRNC